MRAWVWFLLAGCADPASSPAHPAAVVADGVPEASLPTVRLSAEAAARLGLEQGVVEVGAAPQVRLVGGEVIARPGGIIGVPAAVAGRVSLLAPDALRPGSRVEAGQVLFRLTVVAPVDRDTRARVEREVAAAEANLAALEQRVGRAAALVDERAGSVRSLEEGVAARDVARADLDVARARAQALALDPLLSDVDVVVRAPMAGVVRSLLVADGQVVAAGALLVEVVDTLGLQVRVPVFSGDLARLDTGRPAGVRRVGDEARVVAAFVQGPPTAEPDRGTVDRYLAVPADAHLSPGERVLVELPLQEVAPLTTVPASALVFDAWGGAWIYLCEGDHYRRVRVDPVRRAGDRMVIARGPAAGACIVTIGAAELFGTEFPAGH